MLEKIILPFNTNQSINDKSFHIKSIKFQEENTTNNLFLEKNRNHFIGLTAKIIQFPNVLSYYAKYIELTKTIPVLSLRKKRIYLREISP